MYLKTIASRQNRATRWTAAKLAAYAPGNADQVIAPGNPADSPAGIRGSALCILATFRLRAPGASRVVTMVTGSEGGAYEHFGKIYKEALAREGIELRLRRTSGSVENVRLLNTDPEIDLGFVQGGILNAPNSADLNQLGSLFPEPLWIFTRPPIDDGRLSSLSGKRIGIGASGSGTQLLPCNCWASMASRWIRTTCSATEKSPLRARSGVARSMHCSWSPARNRLFCRPCWPRQDRPPRSAHSEAYKRRFPHLETLTLPAATLDFVGGRPAHDVHLLGSNAVLVGKVDLHPALVSLLLQTAKQVHGEPGLFQRRGEFPAIRDGGLPVNPQAQRFYEYGTPLLQRYLPFWLAVLIDRLLISLLPVLAILLPLIRIAPPLYAWRKRSKIYRWYGELKFLEQHARTCPQSELGRFSNGSAKSNCARSSAGRHSLSRTNSTLCANMSRSCAPASSSGGGTARPHPRKWKPGLKRIEVPASHPQPQYSKENALRCRAFSLLLAEWTGLEPATPA